MSKLYSEEIIEEIRSSNDIVDVISGYLSLKKSGNSFKAKCPFHTEKTPSFSVSPEKQIYHCFGCGVGGNVINFVMAMENLGFVDALKFLADRSGIILADKNKGFDEKEYRDRQIQYNIHKDAARYFYQNLKQNKKVINYLNSRGITNPTIIRFGLGYAKDGWENLFKYLQRKKYSIDDISRSGLVIPKKKSGYYDRFRNRIIFPIFNLTNNIIAFGGRVLDHQLPKYLNSPDTIIFSKGHNLFGLNNAKNNIKNGQLIIVEGYMDVISLYQQGIKNVVATLGTAITHNQAKILNRYASDIIIAYDGDKAGRNATINALNIFETFNSKVKVLTLPTGIDPDEYIKKHNLEGFISKINKSLSIVEYRIMLAREKYNINSTEGKIDFSKEVAHILKNIRSEIEVDAYIKKISSQTGFNEAAIKAEVNKNKRQDRYKRPRNIIGNNRNTNESKTSIASNKRKNAIILAEEKLLKAIFTDKKIFNKVRKLISWQDFTQGIHKDIAKIIFDKFKNDERISVVELLDVLNSEDNAKIISGIFIDNPTEKNIEQSILEYISTIKIYNIQNNIDNLNNSIKMLSKEDNVNTEKINKIYIEIINLKKELEMLKGK